MYSHKISIIGAGAVGSTIAYTLMIKNVTTEILLVDVDQAFVEGQVLDLSDTASVSSCKVKIASLKEAGQAGIIVYTAGAKQKEGESRTNVSNIEEKFSGRAAFEISICMIPVLTLLSCVGDQLIDRNYYILQSVIEKMKPISSDAIMLMVSSPVDTLTQIAQALSGLPKPQVFESGTYLDATCLRELLSQLLHIDSLSIHAYVLGEHGDSQYIPWSSAAIADKPLFDFQEIQKMDKNLVRMEVAGKALRIIKL